MSILKLAQKINLKGDQFIRKNGIKEFHKEAQHLLATSDFHHKFDFQEIVEGTFNSKHSQNFRQFEFSDLPLTLFRGEHCFIDLYFWRRRPTVIHNHHFTGAFMCLLGQNVDLEYSFSKTRKLGKFHELGILNLKQERKLLPGDTASIPYLDKFIHQNHHQADLTVNLCFRTPQETTKSLSNYLFTGLKYGKDPDLLGRVNRLKRFIDMGDFDFKKLKLNPDDALNFLIQAYNSKSENPRFIKLKDHLNQWVKKELDVDVFKLIHDHDKKFEEIENDYE